MKKVAILVAVLAFVLTGCNKDSVSKNYKGKYEGTYTFLTTQKEPKSGKVPVLSNPASTNGVLVYDIIPLEASETEGIYEKSTEQEEFFNTVISAIGLGSTVGETVKNLNLKADFTTANTMTLTLSFTVEIVASATTEIRIVEFKGTKITE